MHAYIVTGGTGNQRTEKIQTLIEARAVSPYDCITMVPSPTSIGVDSVRSVQASLSIRPVASSGHAVIIRDAQTMTPEAQNAFLKTLEEPSLGTIIFLETVQPDALLPTILSRCHIIRLPGIAAGESDETGIKTIKQLLDSSLGERLKRIDTIAKTRDDALFFVDLAIPILRKKLVTTHTHAKPLRSLLTARTQIMDNITPKLALDNAFLIQ